MEALQALEELQVQYSGTRLLHRGLLERSVAVLSTGFPALDAILRGGLPRGRVTELAARGTAGQETLAASILKQAQLRRGAVAWVDSAGDIPLDLLAAQGVAIDRLLVLRPEGPEQTLSLLHDVMTERSITATIYPLASLAEHERLDRPLASWLPSLEQSQGVLVMLLDLAESRGPGFSFYASLRLQLAHQAWRCESGRITGYRTRVTVLKNKQGPAGLAVDLDLALPEGIR
ncbi:MAG: P-loop NTPase family protein [Anaerolineae bacterium]